MKLEYIGLSQMEGSLIYLDGVSGIGYDEMAEISLTNGEKRYGRVIMLDGSRAVLQVFEGTKAFLWKMPGRISPASHGAGTVYGNAGTDF